MPTSNMLFLIFALIAASLAGAAGPLTLPRSSDFTEISDILPDGYTLGQMKFTGSVGGVDVVGMEGSIQEIVASLKNTHPHFKLELISATANETRSSALAARAGLNKDTILCCPVAGHNWIWASRVFIQGGIDYLAKFNGRCRVGKQSCVRISCDYGNAIWLFNDNPYPIEPACNYIGSYALDLVEQCSHDKSTFSAITCGQEFDTDNYNVVVTKQWCGKDSHLGPDGR